MKNVTETMTQLQEQIELATIAETAYDVPIMSETENENSRQRLGALKKRHRDKFIKLHKDTRELKTKALSIIEVIYGKKPWE